MLLVLSPSPRSGVVALTDYTLKVTFPDGKTEEGRGKAGQAVWWPATKHLVDNLGDTLVEVLAVEIKTKSAGATNKAVAPKP